MTLDPKIDRARRVREWRIDEAHTAYLLTDVVAEGAIQYAHVLTLYREGEAAPVLYITAEYRRAGTGLEELLGIEDMVGEDVGRPIFLCIVTALEHRNLGAVDGLDDPEAFALAALDVLGMEHLRQLVAAQRPEAAVAFYANPDLPAAVVAGATRFLTRAWLGDAPDMPVRLHPAGMLAPMGLPPHTLARLAHLMLSDLSAAPSGGYEPEAVRELLALLHPVLLDVAVRDAGHSEWQGYRALTRKRLGSVLEAHGDPEAALACFRDGLALLEGLVDADPGNPDWQRELSAIHYWICDVLEELCQSDPGTARWRHELSLSYARIADDQKADGDLQEALRIFRISVQIMEGATEADPVNPDWLRDLAMLRAVVSDLEG